MSRTSTFPRQHKIYLQPILSELIFTAQREMRDEGRTKQKKDLSSVENLELLVSDKENDVPRAHP